MSNAPVVKFDLTGIEKNTFTDKGESWYVANLFHLAKDLIPFDLPLAAIDSGAAVWSPISSAYDLAKEMQRVRDLDPSFPVILDERGFIMDGWHRVARGLLEGKVSIPAVRFDKTPPSDFLQPKEK